MTPIGFQVGYSFGAVVAFEMGVLLEKEGEKVRLFFIDGSPSYVATHTGKARSKIRQSEVAEESEALCFFIMQFKEVDQQKVCLMSSSFFGGIIYLRPQSLKNPGKCTIC